jgi:nucleotide-binding universal stress UspA family protein
MTLLERVVVPVANETDTTATATAISPYLDRVRRVVVVHVVEKGGGVADKAPMGKRRADAREFLSEIESRLDDEVAVETRVELGTKVAETIVETALDEDATAIAFRPRGGNRLVRFLSGDTALRLLTEPELPVVSITGQPRERATSASSRRPRDGDSEVGG